MRQNSTGREVANLEEQMLTRPPVIVWRLHPTRRVQVAVSVDDPYQDAIHTQQEHNRSKTECTKGHAFDEANTVVYANGWRDCRQCKRERNRESGRRRRREKRAEESAA